MVNKSTSAKVVLQKNVDRDILTRYPNVHYIVLLNRTKQERHLIRIQVFHFINRNMLLNRDPVQYGTITLVEIYSQIVAWATGLGSAAECMSPIMRPR